MAATLSLDGCHDGMPYDTPVALPHLLLHGYSTSRILFERTAKDVYSVTVADTAHLDYLDQTLLEPVYRELGYTSKTVNPERMLAVLNTYARAFFDRYVRGLAAPALAGRPPFDNVIVEMK